MSLLEEADIKLQENDCRGARDDYRAFMAGEAPSSVALANLGVAEECEVLLFRRELASRFPESEPVKLELARMLSPMGGAGEALALCGELLAELPAEPASELRIRQVRLKIALAGGQYEVAAEDFLFVLGEFKKLKNPKASRRFEKSSAAMIAGLDKGRAMAFIAVLRVKLPQPHPFDELLALKAAELEALKRFDDND